MKTISEDYRRCLISRMPSKSYVEDSGRVQNSFDETVGFNASWTFRWPSLKTQYNESAERPKELNSVFKKIDSNRSKLYAGFAGIAALTLFTACGANEPAPEEEPAEDPK